MGSETQRWIVPDGPPPPVSYVQRLWREWCFWRAAGAHFRVRLLLMATVLLVGGLLFWLLDHAHHPTLLYGVYTTWSLVFANPTEDLPTVPILQVLFFIVPVLGLVFIIEAIVEFSMLLRDRRRNERSWCKVMAASLSNHVVLIGLGKLGYRSYRLLQRLGESVVVIERNSANTFVQELRAEGVPILIGDARHDQLLVEANVAKARCIIVASNDDLANLEVALDARRMNPDIRVVVRMFDQNLADKVRAGFNIQIAMSQSAISAPAFVMAAVEGAIVGSHVIGDQLVLMQRWTVGKAGPLCGRTVAQLLEQDGVGILERRSLHGETRLLPPPQTVLTAGDEVVVQAAPEVLRGLRARAAR